MYGMLLVVGILFILMAILGYKKSKSYFSPYTLVAGEWAIIILLYYLSSPSFYPLEHRFPVCITIWVLGFYVSSFTVDNYRKSHARYRYVINERNRKIILFLSIPSTLYIIYDKLLIYISNPELAAIALREATNNSEVESNGIFTYFVSAILVLLLAEFIRYPSKKKTFYFLLLLNILIGLSTLSRSYFIQFLFSLIVVYSFKKKIALKNLLIPFLSIFLFFVFMQIYRTGNDSESFVLKDFFDSYLFGGMIAFDRVPMVINGDGRNVFRFFYAIFHVFDSSIPVADFSIGEFTIGSDGSQINVYTGLYRFFVDFGYWGVCIFSLLYGALFSIVYKAAKVSYIYTIMYAILASAILMFFMADVISSGVSMLIQYSFYSYLLYYPSKSPNNSYYSPANVRK